LRVFGEDTEGLGGSTRLQVTTLTLRNLKVFFRNVNTVAFSMLGAMILIAVFILFGDSLIVYHQSLYHIHGVHLLSEWVVAGLIGIVSLTAPLGALSVLAKDKENDTLEDLLVTPVSSIRIASSYVLSAIVAGTVLTWAAIILCLSYLLAMGVAMPNTDMLLRLFLFSLFAVVCSSFLMALIIAFIKTYSLFTYFSLVTNIMVGLLTGALIPIGAFGSLDFLVKLLPNSYFTMIFRNLLMTGEENVIISGGTATVEQIKEFNLEFGLDMRIGDLLITRGYPELGIENNLYIVAMAMILLTLLLTLLGYLRVRKTRKGMYG